MMIDINQFFSLNGMRLQAWAMDFIPCSDQQLLDEMLRRVDDLDMDHFRTMLALFAEYNSPDLRRVVEDYMGSNDDLQIASINAFLESQRRCGYVE